MPRPVPRSPSPLPPAPIVSWTTEGELQDPLGEFFVTEVRAVAVRLSPLGWKLDVVAAAAFWRFDAHLGPRLANDWSFNIIRRVFRRNFVGCREGGGVDAVSVNSHLRSG